MSYFKVLISATSKKEATTILKKLLKNKLVAGGLITSGLSIHWWKNKKEEQKYFNISAFTIAKNTNKIIKEVEAIHKDETPIVAFTKIEQGNKKFLKWISEYTK